MRRTLEALVLGAFAVSALIGIAHANTTAVLPDKIQEDWQLVVATPSPAENGPQITTSMSPAGNLTSTPYVSFDLNYREYPSFNPGGLQIQVWNGSNLTTTSSQGSAQLSTANETITWTQTISLNAGQVSYSIDNGVSTTWGKFGQGNGLLSVSFSSSLTDLSGYDPAVSVAHSKVTWQSNHVTSFALVQVRYYAGGNLISTDTTRRDIPLPF